MNSGTNVIPRIATPQLLAVSLAASVVAEDEDTALEVLRIHESLGQSATYSIFTFEI